MINFIQSMTELIILSSLAIAAVLLIKLLFQKRLHISILTVMWILVLARLVIPFTVNSPVSVDSWFENSTASEITSVSDSEIQPSKPIVYDTTLYNTENIAYTNADISPTESANTEPINVDTVDAPITTDEAINPKPSQSFMDSISSLVQTNGFLTAVITVWLIGAWLTLFSNGYAIFVFNRKIAACRETDEYSTIKSLEKGKAVLGIKKHIQIKECEFVDTPITYGLFFPKILLPKDFSATIAKDKLYLILLHELSHIKNRDILKNYLWLLARVIYWFNPLVSIAYKRYLDDIEYIADETVVQYLNGQTPLEYTESLLDALKMSNQNTKISVALPFCKSKSKLRKRVENMLKPQKKSKALGMFTIMLCAVIVIACFTTACVGNDDVISEGAAIAESADESSHYIEETTSENNNETETSANGFSEAPSESKQRQPLKYNPVGSAEAAIAIAKSINFTNTEEFVYGGTYDRGIMAVHQVSAKDDLLTNCLIYDHNGEICMMQSRTLAPEQFGEEQPIEVLKQNTIDFAAKLYPSSELTITSCVKDDHTWEVDGVVHESKDYIVNGNLYDNEDGSTRSFKANIRFDGYIRIVWAEYNGMDYLNFSKELDKKILNYVHLEEGTIDIFQISDYYGDRKLHFKINDGEYYIILMESNLSLVNILIPGSEEDITYQLTNDRVDNLVKEYVDTYFPESEYINIKNDDIVLNGYVGEGTMTFSNETVDFYIVLNGDGTLQKMGITPNVNPQPVSNQIAQEAAQENAISELISRCSFVKRDALEVISVEDYKDEYIDTYFCTIKYTTANPSIRDYPLYAKIHIDKYTGKYCRMNIDPIIDNWNVLSHEEAIESARNQIAEEFDIEADKLIPSEFYVMAHSILMYQADFVYPDGNTYYASMLADTGKGDAIGHNTNPTLRDTVEHLKRQYGFIEDENLQITSYTVNMYDVATETVTEFKYISDTPSVYNYSFTATLTHTGGMILMDVEYDENGLSLLTKDEAVEKAKEYIASEYDLNIDELKYFQFEPIVSNILSFRVYLTYTDDKTYSANIFADTGELMDTTWGKG